MKVITMNGETTVAALEKIESRTATAGVIGLGYVGLPLAGAGGNGAGS